MRKRGAAILAASAVLALGAGVASAGTTKYPTEFTSFGLSLSTSGGTFSGKLGSPKKRCVKKRKVTLVRKKSGKSHKVGSDKTNEKGKFKIRLSVSELEDGTYLAKAPKKKYEKNGNKTVCLRAKSGTVTVS